MLNGDAHGAGVERFKSRGVRAVRSNPEAGGIVHQPVGGELWRMPSANIAVTYLGEEGELKSRVT